MVWRATSRELDVRDQEVIVCDFGVVFFANSRVRLRSWLRLLGSVVGDLADWQYLGTHAADDSCIPDADEG